MGDRGQPIPVAKLKQAKASADEMNLLPETLDQCTAPEPDVEDGLTTDEKYLAISRLEVSGRTRSSEGERFHAIEPTEGAQIKLKYGWVCQAGFYPEDLNKKNQDNLLVAPELGPKLKEMALFGVFDGHGKHGTECSTFAVDRFAKCMLAHKQLKQNPEAALEDSLVRTNKDMHKAKKKRKGTPAYFDDTLAGTTAINVLFFNDEIIVANVGDSRAIIATEVDGKVIAQPLSADQTPYRKDERLRCRKAGAVVMTMDQLEGYKPYNPDVDDWGAEEDDGGDPPRLWLPNKGCPGVAFTRSLGDEMAESIGVVANPEILRRKIAPQDKFIVIASDGVFEFLSSQTVADMVQKFSDPYEAARALVAESYKLWLHYEVRTDDITAIVIFLEHPESGSNAPRIRMSQFKAQSTISGSFRTLSEITSLEESRPVRREMSRKKRQIIEASIEEGADDEEEEEKESEPAGRKSAEQVEQIRNAVSTNFLFQHLNPMQLSEVLNAFEVIHVKAGDRVINQGEAGDKFFVVGKGEFDCFIKQEGESEEKKVLTYVARDGSSVGNPSFGELALMYSKPRAASVVAKTDGVLYGLGRKMFRRKLIKRPNRELIESLRKVQILESLGKSQLQRLADTLSEVKFKDGELILKQGDIGDTMYLVKEGNARVTVNEKVKTVTAKMKRSGTLKNLHLDPSNDLELPPFDPAESTEVMRIGPGGYFGEKALLHSEPRAASVLAVGNVTAFYVSRKAFEDVLGPLADIISRHGKRREAEALAAFEMEETLRNAGLPASIKVTDLVAKHVIHSSDSLTLRVTAAKQKVDGHFSLKSFKRKVIEETKTETRVLRDRSLLPLAALRSDDDELENDSLQYVFPVMKTLVGEQGLHLALKGIICGRLSDYMNSPLAEEVARFVAANVLLLIRSMHTKRILTRSINPDTLSLDENGYVRLYDLGASKYMEDDSARAYTLCGDASYMAPEQVLNHGHTLSVDYWALGILLFEMLTGKLPFSDEDPFKQIASHDPQKLAFPDGVREEAQDLIRKLTQPSASMRLSNWKQVAAHPFFADVDFAALAAGKVDSPLKQAAMHTKEEMVGTAPSHAEDDEIDSGSFKGTVPEGQWFHNF